VLNREERTKGPGTLSAVKQLFWYADGSRIQRGNGAGGYGQLSGRRLNITQGKYAHVFQAEVYAILDYAFYIRMDISPKKVCIFSESQTALKSLQVAKNNVPIGTTVTEDLQQHFCGKKNKTLQGNPAYISK
jgi:hypothetical protein